MRAWHKFHACAWYYAPYTCMEVGILPQSTMLKVHARTWNLCHAGAWLCLKRSLVFLSYFFFFWYLIETI